MFNYNAYTLALLMKWLLKQNCNYAVNGKRSTYFNLPKPYGNFFFEDEHSDTLKIKDSFITKIIFKYNWTSIYCYTMCFLTHTLLASYSNKNK